MGKFKPGDRVVPSTKMSRPVRDMIGREVGTIVDVNPLALVVQFSFIKVLGYRNEFRKEVK